MTTFLKNDSVLIIGADGTIGRSLVKAFEDLEISVWQTTRHKDQVFGKRFFLDLSEDYNEWVLPPEKFSIVVICAAVSSIKTCQSDPLTTRQINVVNTIKIAKYFLLTNSFLIFLSTNSVFDGELPFAKPFWPVNPQTEYGKQKAEVEKELLNSFGQEISIVRFNKVLSPQMSLLVDWVSKLKNKEIIHPFFDMWMAPITLKFAVEVLCTIASRKIAGITHVSASQDFSYLQVAQYIAKKIRSSDCLIMPCSYKNSDVVFSPKNTTLDCELLEKLELDIPLTTTVIDDCLGQIL